MKILLFGEKEIATFLLPKTIMGSFRFDVDEKEEKKLINIDERNGKWVLYSTNDVKIIINGIETNEVFLENYEFYYIKREEKINIIYTVPTMEFFKKYKYDINKELYVGNVNKNITFISKLIGEYSNKIYFSNNKFILENHNSIIYINGKRNFFNQIEFYNGDEIYINELKIIVINNVIFVGQINNEITINDLEEFYFPPQEKHSDIEFEDNDLYNIEDYFSKSPRFRRIIEKKEVNLTSPPDDSEAQKMPFILTIGPMLTMGITSCTMVLNTMIQLSNGETTIEKSWPQLVAGVAMMASMLLWPSIINIYNNKQEKKQRIFISKKYTEYLDEKRKELSTIRKNQRDIMLENLIDINTCISYIYRKGLNFWDKRNDQNDFLTLRLGIGNAPLQINISYQEEDFKIDESNLKDKADQLVKEFKYVENTPIGYSFFENTVTAVMGISKKVIPFVNNLIVQLLTFYSYEDLKIVVFTSNKNRKKFEYIKYLNHSFSNDKMFRFFASDYESSKIVSDILIQEINHRISISASSEGMQRKSLFRPQYFIIVDGYDQVKQFDLVNTLSEIGQNIGFSIIIIEERLSNLPSKCNNFINLGDQSSGVLKNSFDNQEIIEFRDEINYNINYMELARKLANTPIEFEEKQGNLPESISFLEMEKVGKVEQLNILNRWKMNDSTNSLKAEVGVDENENLIYLDLHEKFHGPHGLIAGTTGSGKSEFIITYILSMAMNYSPDDVSFILIDYKGGGLTGAFENRMTGVTLPHLAGTITNLDKAEMDRTLVSIDSEVKRRQKKFNEARDMLGESTIDIYKYQRFYKEGRLPEPIPHLFIISDEFAELKSQQPEFMDNLISIARIGRSLGVHLILATQKPSGVVNEQIWSNSKFKVCLKVQDESDSNEMLKKKDAAHIKEAGRFFLQVGYDEIFIKGQSGYCGAKYYPADTIVKTVDKSVNFIDDCGRHIKNIQAGNNIKKIADGEQIAAILKSIIETAKLENKFAKKLWLDDIPKIILEEDIEKKYNFSPTSFDVTAILGEYDAPENQEQNIVTYSLLEDGNTIIYGNDSSENEMLLDALIYSTTKNYTSSEINYYIVDYGSETLRKFNKLPHIGGFAYSGDEESFNNLLKMTHEEIILRKKLFSDYGGEYKNYIRNNQKKIPLFVVIMNNYDAINEENKNLFEDLPELVRDSERYGIIFIITATAVNSVYSKVKQNFSNFYAFKLKDYLDYMEIFGTKKKMTPRNFEGRGVLKKNDIHEFQTLSITKEDDSLNDYILEYVKTKQLENQIIAKQVPILPKIVRMKDINKKSITLSNIPVGISKKELEIKSINLENDIGYIVSSNKLENMDIFTKSLLQILATIPRIPIIILDGLNSLKLNLSSYPNYYTTNFEENINRINEYIEKLIETNNIQDGVIIFYGINKIITKLDDIKIMDKLTKNLKKYEHFGMIVIEEGNKLKTYTMESWYKNIFVNSSGLWIGRGLSDQNIIRVSSTTREMMANYNNDMGFIINDNLATLLKIIDFITKDDEDEQ